MPFTLLLGFGDDSNCVAMSFKQRAHNKNHVAAEPTLSGTYLDMVRLQAIDKKPYFDIVYQIMKSGKLPPV